MSWSVRNVCLCLLGGGYEAVLGEGHGAGLEEGLGLGGLHVGDVAVSERRARLGVKMEVFKKVPMG